jgi:hypothetical protein
MIWDWTRIQEIIGRHRIIYGVIGALLVAMLLTAVSMALYISSGASRLDLSRPGYEHARSDVQKAADEDAFSATGPMNSSVANDFQARFSRHRATLNKLDTYGTDALDDAELQIAPSSE